MEPSIGGRSSLQLDKISTEQALIYEIRADDMDDIASRSCIPRHQQNLSSGTDAPVEGDYLVAGKWIDPSGNLEDAWIQLTLPERIAERSFVLDRGQWTPTKGLFRQRQRAFSLVSVEADGDYNLFYSKPNVELGIDVLRSGLSLAARRTPILRDLFYILRDEGRSSEALIYLSELLRISSNQVLESEFDRLKNCSST